MVRLEIVIDEGQMSVTSNGKAGDVVQALAARYVRAKALSAGDYIYTNARTIKRKDKLVRFLGAVHDEILGIEEGICH